MTKLMTHRGYQNQLERIRHLEAKVSEIESKVGEVTTQSAETWHDNAPYSILVEELRIADLRLREAHEELNKFKFQEYPLTLSEPRVSYGTRVNLLRNGRREEITIVGYGEADYEKGYVLYDCPLALILDGKLEMRAFTAEINGKPNLFYIEKVMPISQQPENSHNIVCLSRGDAGVK